VAAAPIPALCCRACVSGIEFLTYRNAAGKVADFHATRHTFITNVMASRTTVTVARGIARHSTFRLTLDQCSHARLPDCLGALESLLKLNVCRSGDPAELRASGTADKSVKVGSGA
jgi:hypothetical protein